MNPTDIQQIIDKYGRPVWDAALHQVFVNVGMGVAHNLIAVFVVVLLWFWAAPGIRRFIIAHPDRGDSEEETLAWAVGTTTVLRVVLFIVACIVVGNFISLTGQLLNPQWAAIQIIIGSVK